MIRTRTFLPILLAALFQGALLLPEDASGQHILKLEGIHGDVTRQGHETEIEILSFSWGARRAARPADVRPGQLVVTRRAAGMPSPTLKEAIAIGTQYADVRFTVPDPEARGAYLEYKLSNVRISSVQPSRAGDTETITLTYQRIEWE